MAGWYQEGGKASGGKQVVLDLASGFHQPSHVRRRGKGSCRSPGG